MLEKETIQLKTVTASMEENKFVVRIKVKNPDDRTLYVYGSPRRILYDNATGNLAIYLHDRHFTKEEEKIVSPHLRQPRFVPLEGGTETDVKVVLEPVINRIRPGSERGNGPLFEELRISEAREISIEIACQDTPFYYNPKISNAEQLKEWGKVISKAKFQIETVKKSVKRRPKRKK